MRKPLDDGPCTLRSGFSILRLQCTVLFRWSVAYENRVLELSGPLELLKGVRAEECMCSCSGKHDTIITLVVFIITRSKYAIQCRKAKECMCNCSRAEVQEAESHASIKSLTAGGQCLNTSLAVFYSIRH